MATGDPRVANFIIGGTEKAGTTSVFMYLCDHPQVCGSSNKETEFFCQKLTGDMSLDRLSYSKYFSNCQESVPVVMEASPSYLWNAASAAPRIATLLPDIKLLFILRDPIERLYSSYNFHVGMLNMSDEIQFKDYVEMCLAYERNEATSIELGMDEWFLKMLQFGCYANLLAPYYEAFPKASIKVMFFEHLREDAAIFMDDLSSFLEIDGAFWKKYKFWKANVTFSGSSKLLHKAAIYINSKAEPFLRRRPKMKRFLVGCYKKFNQAREGYEPMPISVRKVLDNYYRPFNSALTNMLGEEIPESWHDHVQFTD